MRGAVAAVARPLIGVATAAMLIMLCVSGFVMWRRRKPTGVLGAPPAPSDTERLRWIAAIVVGLALLLPLMAISLVAILVLERWVFARMAMLSDWLGLRTAPAG